MRKPLPFFPRAGMVLVCDFSDFRAPEINKVRPVVVISPRLKGRSDLVSVVPISTTAPGSEVPYVVKLVRNYAPWGDPVTPTWAKCDIVMTVGRGRLSSFKVDRRRFVTPELTGDDLKRVRQGVLRGLGF